MYCTEFSEDKEKWKKMQASLSDIPDKQSLANSMNSKLEAGWFGAYFA